MAQESDPLIIPKELREPSTSHESVEEKSQVTQVSKSHHMKYRQGSALWSDLLYLQEGTIPHSVAVGLVIAVVCGVALFLYYSLLFILLEYVWHTLPELLMERYPTLEQRGLTWTWIPFVVLICAIGVGCCVIFIGEPGDLAYTIKCVHEKGFLELNHMYPMIGASLFSIVGASSLGPEAPVVAICACLSGYISHKLFKVQNRNILRKHTLMGMAAALAAFFGDPLGGSLFALEVNSRFGVEYFEHLTESILCGILTMSIFRSLLSLEMGAIYTLAPTPAPPVDIYSIMIGFIIGIIGSILAMGFVVGHTQVSMKLFSKLGLLSNQYAIQRALLGGFCFALIGLFIPQTMFWGEIEFENIAMLKPASELPFVWPTSGLLGFELNSAWHSCLLGIFKLLAISFSIAGGFRGGFIYPAFCAGAGFGRCFCFLFPSLDPVLSCLCFAASVNVVLTKTVLATPILLVNLSGEGNLIAPILTASMTSLLLTSYCPFIKTQVAREDVEESVISSSSAKNWTKLTLDMIEGLTIQQQFSTILVDSVYMKQILSDNQDDMEESSLVENNEHLVALVKKSLENSTSSKSEARRGSMVRRVSERMTLKGWFG